MGRTLVSLDPPGYKWAAEPGYHAEWTGPQLVRALLKNRKTIGLTSNPFALHPHSDWLMPRVKQMRPSWEQDAELSTYVIPKANWTFAGGISAVEWEPTRLPDGTTFPANKWVTIPKVPDPFTPLIAVNMAALFSAADASTMPTDFGVVAFASQTPAATTLGIEGHGPLLQYKTYPQPSNTLCFGFHNFAVLLHRNAVFFLQSPLNDLQSWRLLSKWNIVGKSGDKFIHPEAVRSSSGSLISAFSSTPQDDLLGFVPVGPDTFYAYSRQQDPVAIVKYRDGAVPSLPQNAWWWAAAPGQKLSFQTQILGYESADTALLTYDEAVELFSLGSFFAPTGAAEINTDGLIHSFPASFSRFQDNNTVILSTTDNTEAVRIDLLDLAGLAWVSDGTNTGGMFRIQILPAANGYTTPALRSVSLKFPSLLSNRIQSTLNLDDTQFESWSVEGSYEEIGGKRLEIKLNDMGLATLSASGHDVRDGYPCEIWEDTDGNGSYDTLRAAGWIDEPELTVAKDGASPKNLYSLRARGLAAQADENWLFLPTIVDPSSSGVTHSYAVAQAFYQSGIDVLDGSRFLSYFDGAPLAAKFLPGSTGAEPNQVAQKIGPAWAPDWGETRIQYAQRIAHEWRGWKLYELLDGAIVYHPDLFLYLRLGGKYFVSATIYRDQASAVAAGRDDQYMMRDPRRVLRTPVANVIRTSGKEQDGKFAPHRIDRDLDSLLNISHPDYLGAPRVLSLAMKMEVDDHAMAQCTRVALLRNSRRGVIWYIQVPLAPWEMGPGTVALGRVVTLQGKGDYVITHQEVEQIQRNRWFTRMACEQVPFGAVAGGTIGDFPGSGV